MMGLVVTLLVHAALVATWQQARKLRLPVQGEADFVQWVRVQPRLPAAAAVETAPDRPRVHATPGPIASSAPPAPAAEAIAAAAPAEAATAPAATATEPAAGPARQMIEQAIRDAGAIDRAVRKDSKPTIVAPRDSPQIRMANKFREAAALAPNKWYEAPKIVELVNDGGDGARRFRVLTALGIYCITERSPATSIDMIEKHGKQRITNCGTGHEQPVNPQEWRTARD
ncbi:hypothetical protein [Massilia sp. CFBP9026]|uniref:hypothetical protein n=1 Tax=Massilia sp. CFBP9026 TaxID=3096536 RepID=UPI002A6B3CF7|nr:hypothetical protein [Massilia sp. CFBP9026]MDY0964727.1 hypothetical protein [Massilia sp. CFBP9026]